MFDVPVTSASFPRRSDEDILITKFIFKSDRQQRLMTTESDNVLVADKI